MYYGEGRIVGSTEHEMIWAIWLAAGKIVLNKNKCWMFACAKKTWPSLLRGINKLVQQVNKVSVMQQLMPGKKNPTLYTYDLQTAQSLQACLLNTLSTANTTPGRSLFFPPHFCKGSLPSEGLFNTVTVYQFCLAQGKTKVNEIFSPFYPKS